VEQELLFLLRLLIHETRKTARGPCAKPVTGQRYCGKRQTSTATPAKPGDLPYGLGIEAHFRTLKLLLPQLLSLNNLNIRDVAASDFKD
jgi:hypothetical protein